MGAVHRQGRRPFQPAAMRWPSSASRVAAKAIAEAESQWPRKWPRSSEPVCSHPIRRSEPGFHLPPCAVSRHASSRESVDSSLRYCRLVSKAEWKALAKEVRLLSRLAHCPYIADVQAVFDEYREKLLHYYTEVNLSTQLHGKADLRGEGCAQRTSSGVLRAHRRERQHSRELSLKPSARHV